jgi:hypothetical protein
MSSTELESPIRLSDGERDEAYHELLSGLSLFISHKLGIVGERIVAKRLVRKSFTVCKVDDHKMAFLLEMKLKQGGNPPLDVRCKRVEELR